MPLVARASKTVRNKNLIIVAACAVFCGWFGYDGFVAYPAGNDRVVNYMKDVMVADGRVGIEHKVELEDWKGWDHEDAANQKRMSDLVEAASKVGQVEGWKKPFDITVQCWIVYVLGAATAASIWWFLHCQRRRAIAEEVTVSPAPGVVIPWEKITRIDNTRWKSAGIVEITYTDAQGEAKKAKFDDYETEREPLLAILDQLAEKAVNAEFIPKEELPGSIPLEESSPEAQ